MRSVSKPGDKMGEGVKARYWDRDQMDEMDAMGERVKAR